MKILSVRILRCGLSPIRLPVRKWLLLSLLAGFGLAGSSSRAAEIVAHRGASYDAPENTLESFREARRRDRHELLDFADVEMAHWFKPPRVWATGAESSLFVFRRRFASRRLIVSRSCTITFVKAARSV